ncbi:MAG: 4a-hydroxytetrahydrobiopterin dehydratase [Chloroflexota bacterium]|nr:4a-hydroxytetrahydrobiopterin dehydratase [Chloroflexota bacterium]
MANLASERCVACRPGSPAVEDDALAGLLAQLDGWHIVEEEGARALCKRYPFRSMAEGQAFAAALGEAADAEDHHPRIVIEYRWVEVSWTTHAIGNLHRNDFVMAAKTDALAGRA